MLLRDVIPQDLPVLVLWGDRDPFTPADGPVGRFFQALPQQRDNTTFTFLPGRMRRGWDAGVGTQGLGRRGWDAILQSRTPCCSCPCCCAGVGHCHHDDAPELVHAELLPFLASVHGSAGRVGAQR